MLSLLDCLSDIVASVFSECGYEAENASTVFSARPDLCEFQCNYAMSLAKIYKKKPIDIANEICEKLKIKTELKNVNAVMPGFINFDIDDEFLVSYIKKMAYCDKFGINVENPPKKVMVDYGGPNVAKPLHIGHLRSAIIGETIKRVQKFFGNEVLGDIHLGDWGLQMGLIIEELRCRKPDLVYFREGFNGEYPKEAPFTLTELEEIYPCASAKSKIDKEFMEAAHIATVKLQSFYEPYIRIWKHILDLSIEDLKKNYENLNVYFDIWKGESDAQKFIPSLVESLINKGLAYESEGALVVDIAEEGDSKEFPPCIIRKSDGGALYTTSDLGTLMDREEYFSPDRYIYIADKRQELHYTQFFRVARLAEIVKKNAELIYIGFGTMNGRDGKPFKTRDGGVMRLSSLIEDIKKAVYDKLCENKSMSSDEAMEIAGIIGTAAIKYGDLSNQALKDYIFDIERFISFEGNTGPYILYTAVRIKSILKKYYEQENSKQISYNDIKALEQKAYKKLALELSKANEVLTNTYLELAPHKICQYIYSISNCVNSFYHEVKILTHDNEEEKSAYLSILKLSNDIICCCTDLLGMKVPEYM